MAKTPKQDQVLDLEKAWAKFKKKDFDKALAWFEEILDKSNSTEALYGKACCLIRCEEYEDALKDLNTLIKNNPKELKYLHARSMVYGAEEKIKDAIKDLKKVVELAPDAVEAYCDLGGAYLISGDYSQAGECFDACIDIDRTCPDAWFGKGMVAIEKKEPKRAIEYLNAAIKIDGKHLLSLLARAEAYFMSNQKNEALHDISKALSLDSNIFKHGEPADEDDVTPYDNDENDTLDEDQDYESFKLDD
jgi:tetratricopeptide (TPR) repeat protein